MTGVLPPTLSVLHAYRRSLYRIGGIEIRIGCPTPALPGPGAWTLLSGANPGGRRMPAGWNRRAMQRLASHLGRIQHRPGEGSLGHWSEPLLLACIAAPRAVVIARRYRQNAIVSLRAGRKASLVLL